MINHNCVWCGRLTANGTFCNQSCHDDYQRMAAQPFRAFRSYRQASQYFSRDVRTVRRYEGILFVIDKTLPTLHTKFQSCKVCGQTFKAHENRRGFCPTCSKAGAGRASQARIISERYRSIGNPNYVDGSAKQSFRHGRAGKHWTEAVIQRDKVCRCCGTGDGLQAHHVIPVALFPTYTLQVDNGVTLCGPHHVALHQQHLDLLLLPVIHAALLEGQSPHNALCCHPEFKALIHAPYQVFRRRNLLQAIPKNYQRAILDLHPAFAQQVLGLSGNKKRAHG